MEERRRNEELTRRYNRLKQQYKALEADQSVAYITPEEEKEVENITLEGEKAGKRKWFGFKK